MSQERRRLGDDGRRSARYRRLEIGRIIELLRAGDYYALLEFIARHRGLLMSHAERFGLAVEDARAVATEVLHDVAHELIERPGLLPRSMDGYVVRCFRNRVFNSMRDASRRDRIISEAVDVGERTSPDEDSAGGCSQAMLRSAAGPAWESIPLTPSLERLAQLLDGGLDDSERQLLAWVSEYVPQSVIATWLGVTHAAARKQLERLRRRLAAAAKEHAGTLPVHERVELLRFFRRVDTAIDASNTMMDRRVSRDA